MIKVSSEELSKISQFVASCNDMINGKFILADVKITKILNMIAGSDELYRYITECMTGFDFSREYHRAEVKNGLNGGVFAVPAEREKVVAFVFCLLVECDAKRIDFYGFINENFSGSDRNDSYKTFANVLLMPFRDIISNHFGMGAISEAEQSNMTQTYREDLKTAPVFEKNNGQVNVQQNVVNQYSNNQTDLQNVQGQTTMQDSSPKEQTPQAEQVPASPKNDIWAQICEICDGVESSVYTERHIKEYLREELLYVIKTIKYSTKYKDVKIISALVTSFDEMSKKCRSTQFVFGELKDKLQLLYK